MTISLSKDYGLLHRGYKILEIEQLAGHPIGQEKVFVFNLPYFLLWRNGAVRIITAGQEYQLEKNSLLFNNKSIQHRFHFQEGSQGTLVLFNPEQILLEKYPGYPFVQNHTTEGQCRLFLIPPTGSAILEKLLQEVRQEAKQPGLFSGALIGAKLVQLLIMAERQSSGILPPVQEARDPDICERLRELIHRHFVINKTVAFYARNLHFHPNHLNKIIKRNSGYTVRQWIQKTVITESKSLLLHTNLSAKEISDQLGFRSPDHFSAYFKRETSMNLAQFRKKFAPIPAPRTETF